MYYLEAIHPHTGHVTRLTFTRKDWRDREADAYRKRRAIWGWNSDPWTVRTWDDASHDA